MPVALPHLRLLIADDEPLVRQRMHSLLKREPDVSVVAECANGNEVVQAMVEHLPDLAFLDIDMPGMDGITAVKTLPVHRRPLVVFVTAHQDHALEAFDLQAIDYLLKPYRPERLRQALGRARRLLAGGPGPAIPPSEPTRRQRLIIRTGDRMVVVSSAEIDWIESADNYAVIHMGRTTHVLRETLTELEARLTDGQFLRVSRSAVVNLERVREIRQEENGGHVMLLAGGERLPITRGIREVQARLEKG